MGKRLYVGNLPYDAEEAGLRELFAQDGRVVERVHIVLDRETQKPRGFAFVEMASEEHARAALQSLDGTMYGIRAMRISEAEDRRGPGGPGGAGGPPRGPGGAAPRSGPPPRPSGPSARPASSGSVGGDSGMRNPDGSMRPRTFGPDARPKRERDQEFSSKKPKRRLGGDGADEGEFGGRRGSRRYDDDDE